MAAEEKQEQKLDLVTLLGDFLKIARRHILLCLVLAVIGSGAFAFLTYRSYVPQYTASASFSVRVANPLYGSVAAYNTATAEQMAKTFPYVLTSGVLQERVMNHLGISRMPSVKVSTSTSGSIITIEVTDRDPQLAFDALGAVMVYYPEIAEYVVGATHLVLLDESGVPTEPVNRLSFKGPVVKGAVCGFALWAAIMLALALMVNTIHNEKELKSLLNIPCVGQIPHIRRSVKKGSALLYQQVRSSGFNEAVRLLRMRVEKAMAEHGRNVLLISSAIPGEGKTTISANLALSLAHKDKKVLIIDCDLRNPSVDKTLKLAELPKIGDYLEGKLEAQQVISATEYKNLYVVAGGVSKESTMRSLRMARLDALVEDARQEYDLVILDTPPCSLLADASEFAAMADCGLMVVRQEYASREQILDGIQRLSDADLPLIGCAMNHIGSHAGHGYGYGYGYGYYSENEDNTTLQRRWRKFRGLFTKR